MNIDRILARGYSGGPRRDQVLKEVLRRSARAAPRSPLRRFWPTTVAGVASACAVGLYMLMARHTPDSLTPKGATAPGAALVDMGCGPRGLRLCGQGDVLMFEVGGAARTWYLAAYTERADDLGHARIWYFPTSTGMTPVTASAQGSVVRKGIAIGQEHRPGKYRTTIVLSSRPLTRAEVEAVPAGVVVQRNVLDFEVVAQARTPP
jgi:hypothetical protein